MMKLQHTHPIDPSDRFSVPLSEFDQQVIDRHQKVAEIVARHLDQIGQEIQDLDPETMMIDQAGDRAEIARQVLTLLVDQMRGFGSGSRREIAERKAHFGGDDPEGE